MATFREDILSYNHHRFSTSKPLVTVLICNYNYGRYLGEAIESALNQTWKNIEIIVVDDGSTDESRDVLKKYEGNIKTIYKENGGQASAFNIGVAMANGDVICFLDSDDFWYPHKIENVLKKYREASWGLVCHHLHEVDTLGNPIKNLSHAQITNSSVIACDLEELLEKHHLGWVFSPTSGMSLPVKLAKQIFPLPEREWRICADNPLAIASVCHAPVGVIDMSLGAYRYHNRNFFASTRNDQFETRIYDMRIKASRFLFLKKYLAKIGRNTLDWTPKHSYQYYRSCCLISRTNPWRYLYRLWKLNYLNHFKKSRSSIKQWFNLPRFFILDGLLVVLIALNLPNPYTKIRKRYLEIASELNPDIRNYLEDDN